MQKEHTIIIGAGPCGMACAIALQEEGINPLIIEKGNIAETIYNYPTHQTFFSSSDNLEIGDVAFITEKHKPVRMQALAYYRGVASRKQLRVNTFEAVQSITQEDGGFLLDARTNMDDPKTYRTEHVVIATGYYDQPNYMQIPGEDLDKVSHYFKEGHPFFDKNVVIIGGKNSAVDTALELNKAGANITVLYRGADYSKSIKPWILPEFRSLADKEIINMVFNAYPVEITSHEVHYIVAGKHETIPNDFVFAMTGYHPNHDLLHSCGVKIDGMHDTPIYDEDTMETNIPGIYVAGVVVAGDDNNKVFIENGRHHGKKIAQAIMSGKTR